MTLALPIPQISSSNALAIPFTFSFARKGQLALTSPKMTNLARLFQGHKRGNSFIYEEFLKTYGITSATRKEAAKTILLIIKINDLYEEKIEDGKIVRITVFLSSTLPKTTNPPSLLQKIDNRFQRFVAESIEYTPESDMTDAEFRSACEQNILKEIYDAYLRHLEEEKFSDFFITLRNCLHLIDNQEKYLDCRKEHSRELHKPSQSPPIRRTSEILFQAHSVERHKFIRNRKREMPNPETYSTSAECPKIKQSTPLAIQDGKELSFNSTIFTVTDSHESQDWPSGIQLRIKIKQATRIHITTKQNSQHPISSWPVNNDFTPKELVLKLDDLPSIPRSLCYCPTPPMLQLGLQDIDGNIYEFPCSAHVELFLIQLNYSIKPRLITTENLLDVHVINPDTKGVIRITEKDIQALACTQLASSSSTLKIKVLNFQQEEIVLYMDNNPVETLTPKDITEGRISLHLNCPELNKMAMLTLVAIREDGAQSDPAYIAAHCVRHSPPVQLDKEQRPIVIKQVIIHEAMPQDSQPKLQEPPRISATPITPPTQQHEQEPITPTLKPTPNPQNTPVPSLTPVSDAITKSLTPTMKFWATIAAGGLTILVLFSGYRLIVYCINKKENLEELLLDAILTNEEAKRLASSVNSISEEHEIFTFNSLREIYHTAEPNTLGIDPSARYIFELTEELKTYLRAHPRHPAIGQPLRYHQLRYLGAQARTLIDRELKIQEAEIEEQKVKEQQSSLTQVGIFASNPSATSSDPSPLDPDAPTHAPG